MIDVKIIQTSSDVKTEQNIFFWIRALLLSLDISRFYYWRVQILSCRILCYLQISIWITLQFTSDETCRKRLKASTTRYLGPILRFNWQAINYSFYLSRLALCRISFITVLSPKLCLFHCRRIPLRVRFKVKGKTVSSGWGYYRCDVIPTLQRQIILWRHCANQDLKPIQELLFSYILQLLFALDRVQNGEAEEVSTPWPRAVAKDFIFL